MKRRSCQRSCADHISQIESEDANSLPSTPETASQSSSARHRYNTRSSAKLGKQASVEPFKFDDSFDYFDGRTRGADVMSLRNGPLQSESHLNPCSEPNLGGCANYFKLFLLSLIIIGGVCMGYKILNERNVFSFEDNSLQKELEGIKAQICAMKDNVQYILKAKQDTSKMMDEVNRMFKDLKKDVGVPATKSPCASKKSNNCMDVVHEAIDKYDADKTGMVDYALESSGGKIVSTRNTRELFEGKVTFLGWAICSATRGPNSIIQPNVSPGECWAFKGSSGTAIIRLLDFVYVDGVTLEHIPRNISPKNDVSSAPKDFSVTGLPHLESRSGELLGSHSYDVDAHPIQYFPLSSTKSYDLVEVRFHSNHGNSEYTCVYRVRIHGSRKG